jgi:hypothetical protein
MDADAPALPRTVTYSDELRLSASGNLKLALALPASVKTGSDNVEAKYKKQKNSLVVIMQRVNPLAVESPEPFGLSIRTAPQPTSTRLMRMPEHVLEYCLSFLDGMSLRACELTSTRMLRTIQGNDRLWEHSVVAWRFFAPRRKDSETLRQFYLRMGACHVCVPCML